MGVLANFEHERFCKAARQRLCVGEKRSRAITAAYRETIYKGAGTDAAIAPNARRLADRPNVKRRLLELVAESTELAGFDAAWAMLQLGRRVDGFNLDDYLTPPGHGQRFFDISGCSRELLGRLSEMTIEEDIIEAGADTLRKVRKIKLKPYDPAQVIGLMARINGWEAPKKIAPTNLAGDGPAHYIISEVPLTEDEWERQHASVA